MAKGNNVLTRADGVQIGKTQGNQFFLQDTNETVNNKKNVTQLKGTDQTIILEEAINDLAKGDILYIEDGDFQGYYPVKEWDSSSKKVTVAENHPVFERQRTDVTFTGTKPKAYKVPMFYWKTLKSHKMPDVELQKTEVTLINDTSKQEIPTGKSYGEVSISTYDNPYSRGMLAVNTSKNAHKSVCGYVDYNGEYRVYWVGNVQSVSGTDSQVDGLNETSVSFSVNWSDLWVKLTA